MSDVDAARRRELQRRLYAPGGALTPEETEELRMLSVPRSADDHASAASRREVAHLAGRPVRFGGLKGGAPGPAAHDLRAVILALLLRRNRPCTPQMLAQALIEADGVASDRARLTEAIARELAENAAPAEGALFARRPTRDNLWTPSKSFLDWLAAGQSQTALNIPHRAPCGPANDR